MSGDDDVRQVLLLAALETVRKSFDDDADDWRYSLLRTFREYLRSRGFERRLIDPVEKLLLETGDAITLQRRRARGEKGTTRPIGSTYALACAAAAVTTLKLRHGWTLSGAIDRVSKASGIEARTLKAFRNSLSRGHRHVPVGAIEAHEAALAEMRDRDYSSDQIAEAVTGLGAYLGIDPM